MYLLLFMTGFTTKNETSWEVADNQHFDTGVACRFEDLKLALNSRLTSTYKYTKILKTRAKNQM